MICVKRYLYMLAMLLCIGCQTFMPVHMSAHPVQMPDLHAGLFVPCESIQDGGIDIKITKDDSKLFEGNLDWVMNPPLHIELSNPLGVPVMSLTAPKVYTTKADRGGSNAWQVTGRVPLKPLVTDAHGFLRLDGHSLGIRGDELACLLSLKLPATWKEHLTQRHLVEGQVVYRGTYEGRFLNLTFQEDIQSSGYPTQVCIFLSWNLFWVFGEAHTRWCYSGEKLQQAHGTVGDRYHLTLALE